MLNNKFMGGLDLQISGEIDSVFCGANPEDVSIIDIEAAKTKIEQSFTPTCHTELPSLFVSAKDFLIEKYTSLNDSGTQIVESSLKANINKLLNYINASTLVCKNLNITQINSLFEGLFSDDDLVGSTDQLNSLRLIDQSNNTNDCKDQIAEALIQLTSENPLSTITSALVYIIFESEKININQKILLMHKATERVQAIYNTSPDYCRKLSKLDTRNFTKVLRYIIHLDNENYEKFISRLKALNTAYEKFSTTIENFSCKTLVDMDDEKYNKVLRDMKIRSITESNVDLAAVRSFQQWYHHLTDNDFNVLMNVLKNWKDGMHTNQLARYISESNLEEIELDAPETEPAPVAEPPVAAPAPVAEPVLAEPPAAALTRQRTTVRRNVAFVMTMIVGIGVMELIDSNNNPTPTVTTAAQTAAAAPVRTATPAQTKGIQVDSNVTAPAVNAIQATETFTPSTAYEALQAHVNNVDAKVSAETLNQLVSQSRFEVNSDLAYSQAKSYLTLWGGWTAVIDAFEAYQASQGLQTNQATIQDLLDFVTVTFAGKNTSTLLAKSLGSVAELSSLAPNAHQEAQAGLIKQINDQDSLQVTTKKAREIVQANNDRGIYQTSSADFVQNALDITMNKTYFMNDSAGHNSSGNSLVVDLGEDDFTDEELAEYLCDDDDETEKDSEEAALEGDDLTADLEFTGYTDDLTDDLEFTGMQTVVVDNRPDYAKLPELDDEDFVCILPDECIEPLEQDPEADLPDLSDQLVEVVEPIKAKKKSGFFSRALESASNIFKKAKRSFWRR